MGHEAEAGLDACRNQVRIKYMGMGQNQTTKGPLVLAFVSIFQGSILGFHF